MIGKFSPGEASLSQQLMASDSKKAPPKRTAVALSDRTAIPEPR